MIFAINCHQEDKSGNMAERFFRKKPRTFLPNSIKRDLDYQDLVKPKTSEVSKEERKNFNR